jgi:hypothetical protein
MESGDGYQATVTRTLRGVAVTADSSPMPLHVEHISRAVKRPSTRSLACGASFGGVLNLIVVVPMEETNSTFRTAPKVLKTF